MRKDRASSPDRPVRLTKSEITLIVCLSLLLIREVWFAGLVFGVIGQ